MARSSAGNGQTGLPILRAERSPRTSRATRGQNWFDAVGREHKAARERVAVFDQTSFAKFLLIGQDAEAGTVVDRANDVAKPPGHLVYTQMLNDRGGIECDLTVGRLSQTEYYIVTGTGFATHDFDWISRSIPDGLDARLIDVTSSYAVLSVMGPRSRDVLQGLTEHDLSNAGFPFGRVKRMTVAGAPVLALRVTYVGELGWELHIPVEFAASVYDALMARRASSTASPTPATAPSSCCAWRRATAPGARTSGQTTRRWSPASAGR